MRPLCNCFTQRAVSAWNMLPGFVVEVGMIVVFKRLLGRHMDMEGYGLNAGR